MKELLLRTMQVFTFVALILFACASPLVHAQQQPGVVSGRVTLDGKTAASVEVVLLTESNDRRTELAKASTDAEGRFRLNVEQAGRYRVMPLAPAYVSSNPQSVAKVITVAPGDEIKEIDFSLVLGGVITGQVRAPDGRPVIAERLSVTPIAQPGQSRASLDLPGSILETDDRGVYRIFGLPPGRYLVSAGTASESVAANASGRRSSYARTFHPNVTEESQATTIEVAAGGEVPNVDIALVRRPDGFAVSGRIVDARSNQPLSGAPFGYAAARANGRVSGAPLHDLRADAKGEFLIEKVTPGRYMLFVTANNENAAYSEMLPFEVTSADVTGLELRAEQGSSVSGVVVVEGVTDVSVLRKLAGVSLGNILYQPELLMTAQQMPVVNADGTFRLNGLRPGKLRVANSTQRLPRGFSVLRVERDGIAQRDGLDIPAEATHIGGVRIVMGYGNGIIRGQVTIKSSDLPPGTPLVVLARRADAPAITTLAEVDPRGGFILEGLTAGEYEVTVGARQAGTPNGVRWSTMRPTVRVSDNSTANVNLVFDSETKSEP
ncbi:MAG TPA: hypothetical protein VJT15_05375 [Pyrinomonadaceae bacterium]|nr:hypothetical protein [Pyrinomonadaceae bacterium]